MRFLVIALLMGLSAAFAQAGPYADPVYLSKTEISIPQVMTPPPVRGSAQDLQDIATILQLQNSRTAEDCQRAAVEANISLKSFFGAPYGPLSDQEVAKWESFFEKVRGDVDFFAYQAKQFWGRPRPFLEDQRVNPCVKREGTLAYPSGHAAISRVFASLLMRIFPERTQVFAARADQIAFDRVMSGMHHPTDIEAGKLLGQVLFQRLMNNANFLKDFRPLLGQPLIKVRATHHRAYGS